MDDITKHWVKCSQVLQKQDPRFAPLVKAIGAPTLTLKPDPFRALCEAILSQQLHGKAAQTIINRFFLLSPPYPSAAVILKLSEDQFRASGVSAQKQSYLYALATAWRKPAWREGWAEMSDDALVERLTEVKGIGLWTAQMFLIFSLGRPDVLPIHDFGIRRGVQCLYGMKEMPAPKAIPRLAEPWKGVASVACWYLWRAVDQKLIAPPEAPLTRRQANPPRPKRGRAKS